MKLATIADGTRDGTLVILNRSLTKFTSAADIAPTMQAALDDWDGIAPKLATRAAALEAGQVEGHAPDWTQFLSPLPRAYEWVDGSAYLNHVRLVRKARNAEPPATLETDPLVYQGGSGTFLAPTQDIPLANPAWGLDFEAEICVILGDTPQGVTADEASEYIKLVMICNDITLRNLIPTELKKGFGFFNGKPSTAFSPVCVTPDELGDAWKDGRLHLPLCSWLNGELVGDPEAGPEMHFSFHDLLAHVAKTRGFTAGSILGSGTVSNEDRSRGSSCLSEVRMIEIIDQGSATTEYMKAGDHIRIEMTDDDGMSIFGAIDQRVSS